jgi:polyhydroxybutyrate depolymerase
MNRKSLNLLFISFLFIVSSCQKEDSSGNSTTGTVSKGKNRFTLMVDGVSREYYVHVPEAYTGTTEVPVVFMLHGTSGNGEDFYTRSGWKEVGEEQNILTVFPSSLRFCINDNGEIKNTTKWNTPPDADWTFCPGQTPKDDIKFLTEVINEIQLKYKIDNKRIYLVGFSNGGQMAAKCAISLSDKLAAVVENASAFYKDTVYVPKRKLPVMFQVGNEDYGPGNTGPALPLSKLDTLISTPGIPLLNGKHYNIAHRHVLNFGLTPNHIISGDTNSVTWATYRPAAPATGYEFRFVFVKNLMHAYPNGENHWMEAARVHWAWLKQFSLP